MKRFVFWLLFSVAVVVQLFPPERKTPVTPAALALDSLYRVPADVANLLKRACYDCHSHHTHYPWYVHVQPIGWWLAHHVSEGREALNFSVLGSYSSADIPIVFREIADETRMHLMPLPSYKLAHPEARLTDSEVERLVSWARQMSSEIQSP